LRARNHPLKWTRRHKVVECFAAFTFVASLGVVGLSGPSVSFASTTTSCTTSDLVVWLNTSGSGAAGSAYYNLDFTNLSAHSCTLQGYPAVWGLSLANTPLGSPAARNAEHSAALITLTSARTATGLGAANSHNSVTAILQITDVGNFPASTCAQVTAAGLRVFPPGQPQALIPFPFVACGKSGPHYLHVEAIQKYVATQ